MNNTNKTILSVVVLVLVAGLAFFLLKHKRTEAPMNTDYDYQNTMMDDQGQNPEQAGEQNPGTVETGTSASLETLNPNAQVDATVSANNVKEFTITGKNFSFSPSSITVKKGDKVKITFKNTEGFHDFKIDEFGVATKQAKSPDTEVLEFVATKSGSFEYYCSVGSHRSMGMKGTLIVQ